MRVGLLIGGIGSSSLGFGVLYATASFAASCPSGYTCTDDSVELALGGVLLGLGLVMLVLSSILRDPSAAAPTWAARSAAPSPQSVAASSVKTPQGGRPARLCSHCGAPAGPGAVFCKACGEPL